MSELLEGLVVRADAKVCHIDAQGRILLAAPRGKLFEADRQQKNPIAVGDRVLIDLASDPASIESVLPRRNYLGRTASSHDPREQVLVANIDRVFIVGSIVRPGFSSNRTDRILAACFWHDIPATLVVNKIDLAHPDDLEALRETYADAGVEMLRTCALTGEGIEPLRDQLKDRVSMLYGASGAGKSSLLNALQPALKLRTGKISKYWDAGKHTTAFSQLHKLDFGGWVIDTPGIRVFRLHNLTSGELRMLFPEFLRLQERCRFPDCTHNHEPDCAVFAAVESGEVNASRYASYVEMLDELGPPPEDEDFVEPPERTESPE
jgi:ribosome biogenesis GTPase / thiamine phosphate phosphatase